MHKAKIVGAIFIGLIASAPCIHAMKNGVMKKGLKVKLVAQLMMKNSKLAGLIRAYEKEKTSEKHWNDLGSMVDGLDEKMREDTGATGIEIFHAFRTQKAHGILLHFLFKYIFTKDKKLNELLATAEKIGNQVIDSTGALTETAKDARYDLMHYVGKICEQLRERGISSKYILGTLIQAQINPHIYEAVHRYFDPHEFIRIFQRVDVYVVPVYTDGQGGVEFSEVCKLTQKVGRQYLSVGDEKSILTGLGDVLEDHLGYRSKNGIGWFASHKKNALRTPAGTLFVFPFIANKSKCRNQTWQPLSELDAPQSIGEHIGKQVLAYAQEKPDFFEPAKKEEDVYPDTDDNLSNAEEFELMLRELPELPTEKTTELPIEAGKGEN
ncbi:MAG: hypothetical protein M1549_00960 [Candidatus Dependentiae bacterium]|nr:hypothetical protein [Candidatus Dependentiae bacterium]